jgi:peptidoglycan-associated lipoprotein
MKANLTSKLMIAAALAVAATGCAKKKPAELPPAPIDPSAGQTDQTGVGEAVVPGSQQDFVRSVSSDTIYFDTDQYNVDAEDQSTLDSQIGWLQRYPNARVTLEGHADERGTREYNIALGDRRANAAKNYLVTRGIPAERISTISYGKERPKALGSDESSWAQNRRAVTVIIG